MLIHHLQRLNPDLFKNTQTILPLKSGIAFLPSQMFMLVSFIAFWGGEWGSPGSDFESLFNLKET